jgi:xylulose-5-phosphate/fructose-6-phosphate phosphoketolase
MNDTGKPPAVAPLAAQELRLIDGWWRAANYLSVGQICLLANPLLKEALASEHIKPRLLGHWGRRRDSISSMRTSTALSGRAT